MVDIPRQGVARARRIRQAIYGGITLVAVILITLGVSRLKPAAPSVDRATVWIDTVKRGSMIRQVRGTGTLVPEDIRWIPARTDGRVEQLVLDPGARVTPDSVILVLSNPELEQSVLEARLQYEAAQAQYENRRAELESLVLNQEAQAANVAAQYREAALRAEADALLAKDGLVSEIQLKISKSQAEELRSRAEIERRRFEIARDGLDSQLAPQEAEVNRLRTMYELRRRQLQDLQVKAGMSGVLQTVLVQVGQQVTPGTNLCRVADPTTLKAELRIAETQAKDIEVGQVASVDTRNGVVPGRVARIDPAAQGGTVLVDVRLEGVLPRGARPDLTVDGTIELERLENVLYVGRPAFGQESSTVGLFRLGSDGEATRVQVRLGRSSVNTIEILEGLNEGEQVVLSDMSAWDAFDRVRLN